MVPDDVSEKVQSFIVMLFLGSIIVKYSELVLKLDLHELHVTLFIILLLYGITSKQVSNLLLVLSVVFGLFINETFQFDLLMIQQLLYKEEVSTIDSYT
jgi:hypothetical protein